MPTGVCSVVAVVAWLTIASSNAEADTQATEAMARRLFARATAAYQHADYKEALAHYREAYELVARPKLLFNMARCEERLGDDEAAYHDYQRFLAEAPPELAGRNEAAAKLVALEPKLMVPVQIAASPEGASIYVDESQEVAGRAPASLSLRPGRHRLRLVAENALPKEVEIEAKLGAASAINVVLERLGILIVRAQPPDAEIRLLDGVTPPAIGSLRAEVAPGSYRLVVRRSGYAETKIDDIIGAGETVRQQVALARPSAVLSVRTNLDGATVFVDAMPAGMTAAAHRHVSVEAAEGPHDVAVEHAGYLPWHGQVHFSAGAATTLEVRLVPQPSRGARAATWTLGGVAAASGLAATVVGLIALRDHADFNATPSRETADSFRSNANLSYVLFGTSAAALVAAGVVHHVAAASSEGRIGMEASP